MSYAEFIHDLKMIDDVRAELDKEANRDNPLRDMLEVMTDIAERHMGPKTKPKITWGQVWERLDNILRCDK